VKQIVGGTLSDEGAQENFVAEQSAAHFASMYRADQLRGGHVIQLGPGNREAAEESLSAYPGGLQLGGGVSASNARKWLDLGASQVIVTSFLFEEGELSEQRLAELTERVKPEELVIDLSCRRTAAGWNVATNRWQTITDTVVDRALIERLSAHCSEFLVHAADVEGLCRGIDGELVKHLGELVDIPCTYAGGAKALSDLDQVAALSGGKIDLTFGSSLDIFGGELVRYSDCVKWNQAPGS